MAGRQAGRQAGIFARRVSLDDGTEFTIDFDELSDPDGRHYALIGSVSQDSEGGDVVYELDLVEDQPRALTQAQIEAAWRDTSPDASDADLAAFQPQRASGTTMPAASIEIDSLVQDWLDTAAAGETETFTIKLAEQPSLNLPQVGPGLADTDPTFVLDQMEDRLIAIEARKTEVEALQADLVAKLATAHVVVTRLADPWST
ncbi:MAG: hypothetical protein GXP62_12660 [Oligoflexia bacterium]|nr:hypothetical protein [Oligoflexia bacterium]